jgi:hypothetical protein
MERDKLTRRLFLGNVAAAFPIGIIVLENTAFAQDLPHLATDDAMATALGYVEDVENIDTSSPLAARYEPGQNCANCAQLQGEPGEPWRPCNLFPGKLVAENGWCSVWAEKPA